MTLAQAQVRSPSDPGYTPTAPPAMTKEAALDLLGSSGYKLVPVDTPPTPTPGTPVPDDDRGRITKDGVPLSLVIGVATNDPTSVAVANTAADQLRNVGIEASVLTMDPVALYGDALAQNRVDAIVGWHQAGGDLATALVVPIRLPGAGGDASVDDDAGCAPDVDDLVDFQHAEPAAHDRHHDCDADDAEPGAGVRRADPGAKSNLTGVCDRSIQPRIDAALRGTENIGEVIDAVEPRLWNMSTVLPILQDTTIVAAGPRVQNVSLSGAVPVGIVGDAGMWAKKPQ